MGTVSFAKMHPLYVKYLSVVTLPGFSVTIYGDEINRDQLMEECEQEGKPGLLNFAGFIPDVASVLASSDVFAYLLNPTHYGTAENALLEAMSAGVVPVVLNNPCERAIVQDRKTGLIVDSPSSFERAMRWLYSHPEEWRILSQNASEVVREVFTPRKMCEAMMSHYSNVREPRKRSRNFKDAFGSNPEEWFLSCHRAPTDAVNDIEKEFGHYNELDETKGSAQHFARYFPDCEAFRNRP